MLLKNLAENVTALVFPLECEICHATLPPSPPSGVCARCESEIRWLEPPFCVSCGRSLRFEVKKCAACEGESFHYDRAFACAFYEGTMRELIHAYKFGGRKYLKNFFARSLARFIHRHLSERPFDAVAAVPMDPEKKRSRGFNQSELLSAPIALALEVPDASKELTRKKSDSPQALLAKTDRKSNVKDRFAVKNTSDFKAKNVLLIDDILTTGHTASECAKALKNAGAGSVTVLTCARGR